jgi:hypothetical protein
MRVLVSILVALSLTGCTSDWKKAEKSAQDFAKNVEGATGNVTCTHADTDKDGYCGCTIFVKGGDPLSVDCGCPTFCLWNCPDGCKMTENIKMRGAGNRTTRVNVR